MTSKLTREERVQSLYGLKIGQVLNPSDIESIKMLARMALAAMDSEPDCNERKLFCSTDTARMRKVISVSAGSEATPLHRHPQPAPVAPVCTCPSGDGSLRWPCPVHPGNSPVIPDGWTGSDKANAALMMLDRIETADPIDDDRIDGIKRIVRELAAAPHDAPALNSVQSVVTVPGKWIPVSERMPEAGVKVLCFPVEDEPIHAVFNGQLWLQDVSWSGSEEPIDNVIPVPVTHWMPLPEAPQEVSDA